MWEKFESNLPVCICTEIITERDLVEVTHLCVSLTRTRTLLPAVETSSNTPTLKLFKFQSFRHTENMFRNGGRYKNFYTEIDEQLRNYSFEVQISKYIAYFWKKQQQIPNIVFVLQIQFSYTSN